MFGISKVLSSKAGTGVMIPYGTRRCFLENGITYEKL
mgnify:CR=1 FL=1